MKLRTIKVRSLMYRNEVTQTALAEKTGVSRRTVSLVCNGKSCSQQTAQKIADALGVNLDTIKAKG